MNRGSEESAARRYDVVLLGVDERRDIDEMLRDIARAAGLSAREIARLVREVPCTLVPDVPERDAKALVESLRRVGAYVKPRLQERQVSGPVPRIEPAATSGTALRRASSSSRSSALSDGGARLFPSEPVPPASGTPELPPLGLADLGLAELELPQPRAFSSAPPEPARAGSAPVEPAPVEPAPVEPAPVEVRAERELTLELGALDFVPARAPGALTLDLHDADSHAPERSVAKDEPSSASGARPELVLDDTVPPADLALDLPLPVAPPRPTRTSHSGLASTASVSTPAARSRAPVALPSVSPTHAPGGIGMFLIELPKAFTTPLAGASVILLGVHLVLYYVSFAALVAMFAGLFVVTRLPFMGLVLLLGGGPTALLASAVSVGIIFRYASHCYEGARSGEFRPDVGYESRAWQDDYGWPGAILIASMIVTWIPLAVYLAFSTFATLLHTMPTDPSEGVRIIAANLLIVPVYALLPTFGVTLAAAEGNAGAYWSVGRAFGALKRMPVGLLIVFALGGLAVIAPGVVATYALTHQIWWLALLSPVVVGYMQAVQASAFGILERNAP